MASLEGGFCVKGYICCCVLDAFAWEEDVLDFACTI